MSGVPGRIRYEVPASVEEAVALAAEEGARYLAGGTDLAVQIAEGGFRPAVLVDITRIASLQGIRYEGGAIRLGAAVSLEEIARAGSLPACLVQGAQGVGSPQIRHLGTLGGNICNASPCGDTLAPLLVLAGRFQLRSRAGGREVSAEEFFLAPKATVLQPGELLEAVLLPAAAAVAGLRLRSRSAGPSAGCAPSRGPTGGTSDASGSAAASPDLRLAPAAGEGLSAFRMLGKRNGQVISQVNVAVWIRREKASGRIETVRLAAGSVAPVPLRLRRTEALLQGRVPDEALLREAEALAAEEVQPISDIRASEGYRRRITAALLREALAEALGESG